MMSKRSSAGKHAMSMVAVTLVTGFAVAPISGCSIPLKKDGEKRQSPAPTPGDTGDKDEKKEEEANTPSESKTTAPSLEVKILYYGDSGQILLRPIAGVVNDDEASPQSCADPALKSGQFLRFREVVYTCVPGAKHPFEFRYVEARDSAERSIAVVALGGDTVSPAAPGFLVDVVRTRDKDGYVIDLSVVATHELARDKDDPEMAIHRLTAREFTSELDADGSLVDADNYDDLVEEGDWRPIIPGTKIRLAQAGIAGTVEVEFGGKIYKVEPKFKAPSAFLSDADYHYPATGTFGELGNAQAIASPGMGSISVCSNDSFLATWADRGKNYFARCWGSRDIDGFDFFDDSSGQEYVAGKNYAGASYKSLKRFVTFFVDGCELRDVVMCAVEVATMHEHLYLRLEPGQSYSYRGFNIKVTSNEGALTALLVSKPEEATFSTFAANS